MVKFTTLLAISMAFAVSNATYSYNWCISNHATQTACSGAGGHLETKTCYAGSSLETYNCCRTVVGTPAYASFRTACGSGWEGCNSNCGAW
ncbi:hypothetical protein BGW37DRAFT_295735 [Umbelopsis sp. PMI_123]|nr:hypothetical protein BGW37DRAFT_295735 [Umbelopsis sp. PMI_123]